MPESRGDRLTKVLEWINAERDFLGFSGHLTEIPKGKREDCERCPIALALEGCLVDGAVYYPPVENEEEYGITIPLSHEVQLFIFDFDSGEYPGLELKGDILSES